MVLIQFDLTEKANKNLELYKAYMSKVSKSIALNEILEGLDLKQVRDDFFINENNEGGMI